MPGDRMMSGQQGVIEVKKAATEPASFTPKLTDLFDLSNLDRRLIGIPIDPKI